jgi:phosphopentomutase
LRPNRFIIIVLDSVGIGELPDAGHYGDSGSDTLGNIANSMGGLDLPNFEKLGLGKIKPIKGMSSQITAHAAYGKMAEVSPGKDSIYGHWELMGLISDQPQPTYPHGFPDSILKQLVEKTGYQFIGNRPASGTEIIKELGEEHLRSGNLILYTSADPVLQIAAHEEVVPISRLYEICRIARQVMIGEHAVGRIIARPFIGAPGQFQRTANRKDFSLVPPKPVLLDHLKSFDIPVLGIGKIHDLFAGQGITKSIHTESNRQGLDETLGALLSDQSGLIFTNLVDFDMLWGHRNDVEGYYRGLQEVDLFIPQLLSALRDGDVLAFTADHGCDPTTSSTDHSREYVPLIIFGKLIKGDMNLGVRTTFADLSATVAEFFHIPGTGVGESFLPVISIGRVDQN